MASELKKPAAPPLPRVAKGQTWDKVTGAGLTLNDHVEAVQMIETQGYTRDANGVPAHFWFVIPAGMTREQAFATQEHHGPFASEAEAHEDERRVLYPDAEVIDGGMLPDTMQ
jgi:hypothetical protein